MSGYTPIVHSQKPRVIQSNEIKQRTLESVALGQSSPSPKLAVATNEGAPSKADFTSVQPSPKMANETKSHLGDGSLSRGGITGYN